MEDDYDFDNEFDVEDFKSPAKNNKVSQPKEEDPYFKRKQSFGAKDKNDDDEPFDIEDIKDDDYQTTKTNPVKKDTHIKPTYQPEKEKRIATPEKDDEEFFDEDEMEREIEPLVVKSSRQSQRKFEQPKTFMTDTQDRNKGDFKRQVHSPEKSDYDEDDFEKEDHNSMKNLKSINNSPPKKEEDSFRKKEHNISPKKDDSDYDDDRNQSPQIERKPQFLPAKTKEPVHNVVEKNVVVENSVSLQMRPEMQTPQYQKLVEQNKKLKNELRELAKAADEALQRERQNRGVKKNKEDEPELKEKMQELKEQLGKIDQLKHHIQIMKRQLKNTYNLPKVIEKEDELKAAQKELNKVMEEKNALLKIKKEQNKALDFLNNEGEYEKKLRQVTQELRQVKDEYRKENELYMENDKAMKKLHEKIIVMEEKCRDLQKKIKDKKGDKLKGHETAPEITQESIAALEKKVKQLQDRKGNIEKGFEEEMRALERKKKSLQQENVKLANQLKEKEKEIRLNNLRLKELRKLTRFNAVKPLVPETQQVSKETSANELRNSSRGHSKEEGHSRKGVTTKSRESKPVKKSAAHPIKNEEHTLRSQHSDEEEEPRRENRKQHTEPLEDNYDEENFEEVEEIDDQFRARSKKSDLSEQDEGNKEFAKPNFMKKKQK